MANPTGRPLAVVTGASSGIGYELAKLCAEHGYDLVVAADTPLEEATQVVRALGAEVVVAVDVNAEGAKFMGAPASVVGVLLQSMLVMQRTAVEHQRQTADVVVSPSVGHLRWDEMGRAEEFIEAGCEAARAALPALKELLEPQPAEPDGWFNLRRHRERHTDAD